MHNWTRLVNRQSHARRLHRRLRTHLHGVSDADRRRPAYLAGTITLGMLVQAALAFQQMEGAFAYCISAYCKIAEWKAVMDRLTQFEAAMGAIAQTGTAISAAVDR